MTATTDRRASTLSSGSAMVERLPRVRRSRRALAWTLRLSDLAGITVIYHLAFWLRSGDFTTNLLQSRRWMVVALVVMASLYLFETYRIDRHEPRWRLAARVALAVACAGGGDRPAGLSRRPRTSRPAIQRHRPHRPHPRAGGVRALCDRGTRRGPHRFPGLFPGDVGQRLTQG